MMKEDKIYLAVLNITSYVGRSYNAEHVYGNLILSKSNKVNINNVERCNVIYLGDNIEITQPVDIELAIRLDKHDGGDCYQNALKNNDDFDEFLKTKRFYTFEEVVNAGIKKWNELDLDCPFISLYEGSKYVANEYNSANTVIITK